jgi:hypothetical protein
MRVERFAYRSSLSLLTQNWLSIERLRTISAAYDIALLDQPPQLGDWCSESPSHITVDYYQPLCIIPKSVRKRLCN